MTTKKAISFTLALGLVNSVVLPAYAVTPAAAITKSTETEKTAAMKANLTATQQMAIKLLVANTMVAKKIGRVAAIDESVQRNYGRIRGMFLGSVPASSVAGLAGYLGKESAKTFQSVFQPITELVKALANISYKSAKVGWEVFEFIGLDIVSEKSGKSIEWVFSNIVKPVLEISITKGTAISSGSLTATAVAGTSSFLLFNPTAEDAMQMEAIRKILGYDKSLEKNVNLMVEQISGIFDLNASDKAKLQLAIINEALVQVAKNNFSQDSNLYKIDIVEILKAQKIISVETAEAVNSLRSAYDRMTSSQRTTVSDVEVIKANLQSVLALHAMLATSVESDAIADEQMREEMSRLLGSIAGRLSLVGFNLN